MAERQFIPREGSDELTAAEESTAPQRETSPPSSFSGLKKIAGVAALVGAAALHPESLEAQQSNHPKIEQGSQVEAQRINKYANWLSDMAAEHPALEGATLLPAGREGGLRMDGSSAYTIYLKDKEAFLVTTDGEKDFTIGFFMKAVSAGLDRLESRREMQKIRLESKNVTQAIAEDWLKEMAAGNPELKDVKVFKDNKAGGVAGIMDVFYFNVGEDRMSEITVRASEDTKERFEEEMRNFLRGDSYFKEAPQGVSMEVRAGAAKVMGITGVRLEKGIVTFFKMMPAGQQAFDLKGANSENQKLIWEKAGERDLLLTVIEKDGAKYRYTVTNGIFKPL